MKNGLIRKIGGMLAGAVALANVSCASLNPSMKELESQHKEYLGNGYSSTISGKRDLKLAAKILAGNIIANGTEIEFRPLKYDDLVQSDALYELLRIADRDRDKIINDKEARNMLILTYELLDR